MLIFAVLYIMLYNFDGEFLLSDKTITALNNAGTTVEANEYAGLGMIAVIPAFLTTFVANGIAEEILFRGFFCKGFSKKIGCMKGILLQAALFGIMHNLLFLVSGLAVGVDFHLYEFVYTFLGAFMLGVANEKLFNGSIWPSICLHGLGNFISTLAVIFQWW